MPNEEHASEPLTDNPNAVSDETLRSTANDNVRLDHDNANVQSDLRDKPVAEPVSDEEDATEEDDGGGAYYTIPDDAYPAFLPRWAFEATPRAKIYCALYDEVVLTIQPQDILDEMDAIEITDDFWRSRQISECIDSIIKAARPDALASVLAPMAGHDFGVASRWSQGYFCGNANQRKAVEDMLRAHGMDAEVITAQAFMQRSPVVQILTRVTIALGIHRQDILAAHAKRREARKAKSSKRRRVAA